MLSLPGVTCETRRLSRLAGCREAPRLPHWDADPLALTRGPDPPVFVTRGGQGLCFSPLLGSFGGIWPGERGSVLCSHALLARLPSEGHFLWGGKLLRSPCCSQRGDHLGYSPPMPRGCGYFCQKWSFCASLTHLHGKTGSCSAAREGAAGAPSFVVPKEPEAARPAARPPSVSSWRGPSLPPCHPATLSPCHPAS